MNESSITELSWQRTANRATSKIEWRDPWSIFVAALCFRIVAMTVAHTYRFSHDAEDFGFGWETGRIARALATGRGFSDPMQGHTGPTAWIAPLYPCILAGIFKIFGVYSLLSSWVDLAINSLFSALNTVVLYRIADRCFSRKTALWSAWIWAAFPYAWYWAIHWQWETSLAALLLSCAMLLALRICERKDARGNWIWFGVVNGLIALTNPSLLLWLPFAGIWAMVQNSKHESFGRTLTSAVMAGVVFIAMLAPWVVRNERVFHKFIPVRGNFWVELHLGNTHGTDGLWAWWLHPSHDARELELYSRLGEVRYVERAKKLVVAEIQQDPQHFIYATICRFFYFWYDTPRLDKDLGGFSWIRNVMFAFSSVVGFLGAAWMVSQRKRGAFLFVTLLAAVPIVYYLTFPHPRYRAPIEPMIVVLGVYLFQSAEPKRVRSDESSASGDA